MAASENAIASGTGQGLLDFLDYTVDKRYRSAANIAPLSSAAVQIFRAVDGENFAGIDVKGMDVEDYLIRFGNAVVGKYKQESLVAYERRFKRAVDLYRSYLDTGTVPANKPARRASKTDSGTVTAKATQSGHGEVVAPAGGAAPARQLMEIPFPLQSGGLAYVRLPPGISRNDAKRLAALIETFVMEPRQIGAGHDESDAEGGE